MPFLCMSVNFILVRMALLEILVLMSLQNLRVDVVSMVDLILKIDMVIMVYVILMVNMVPVDEVVFFIDI
jgi:hypothetical protein